ncbi:MAG: tetratricopeptide repeat protein [Oligoflexales bacterium]|nr:tetratricopeptide repeat protein [Oligoflexales bacterium]
MKLFLFSQILMLWILLFPGHGLSSITSDNQITTPEQEIQSAFSKLKNLKNSIDSSLELYKTRGLTVQKENADHIFENAKREYSSRESEATIYYLSQYLDMSQVPEHSKYFDAQYMLGKSYQELGQNKYAFRAYMRYISAYITDPDLNRTEIIDVLKHLLILSEGRTKDETIKLSNLLSGLTNIEFAPHLKHEILFYIAKSSMNIGEYPIADRWLSTIVENNVPPRLKSKSYFYKGFIAIDKKNYKLAEEFLLKSYDIKDESAKDFMELSAITLARLNVQAKKPNTALKYYEEFKEDSIQYRDSLYERIYVYLDMGKTGQAKESAKEYLNKFPDSPDTYQIRTIIGYLTLRDGKLDEATRYIKEADSELEKTAHWLEENYAGRSSLSYDDIVNIKKVLNTQIASDPLVAKAENEFKSLFDARSRLFDIRSQIRNTIYTIGRGNTAELGPGWENRSSQLRELALNVLDVGHRLISAEKELFKDKISESDKEELSFSENRRIRSLSGAIRAKRERGDWKTWTALAEMNILMGEKHYKLKKVQAELGTATYLAESSKSGDRGIQIAKIADLKKRSEKIEKGLNRAIEIIRSRQVKNLVAIGSYRILQDEIKTYASALYDEYLILDKYKDQYTGVVSKYLAEDIDNAWTKWKYVTKSLYDQAVTLDREVDSKVTLDLKKLDAYIIKHDGLIASSNGINSRLETFLGKELNPLLVSYKEQIDKRRSMHKKWLADIIWIEYENETNKTEKELKKRSVEETILEQNLIDLKQGALLKWPTSQL